MIALALAVGPSAEYKAQRAAAEQAAADAVTAKAQAKIAAAQTEIAAAQAVKDAATAIEEANAAARAAVASRAAPQFIGANAERCRTEEQAMQPALERYMAEQVNAYGRGQGPADALKDAADWIAAHHSQACRDAKKLHATAWMAWYYQANDEARERQRKIGGDACGPNWLIACRNGF